MVAWLSDSLQRLSDGQLFVYMSCVCFGLYFFVYFWRVSIYVLPNIATTERAFGMDLNTAFALAQQIGFGLSKVPAIRVVSAAPMESLLVLLVAALSLSAVIITAGVALLPNEGKVAAVFVASFPASWIYGTMLRYIEGRRFTEPLAAVLSVSWIFGGGACRAATAFLLKHEPALGLPNAFCVPMVLGLLALVPAVCLAYMLAAVPAPNARDVECRSPHIPMTLAEQWRFFCRFPTGLALLLAIYMLMTSFRNFRDCFLPAIIKEAQGHDMSSAYYLALEIPGGLAAALLLSLTSLWKDNRLALYWLHFLMGAGAGVVGLSTALYVHGSLDVVSWATGMALGTYCSYIVMGIGIYDRLIAITSTAGTSVFLTFASDALGYLGTVAILLYKTFGSSPDISYKSFFVGFSLVTSVVVVAMSVASIAYFVFKLRHQKREKGQLSNNGSGSGSGGGSSRAIDEKDQSFHCLSEFPEDETDELTVGLLSNEEERQAAVT